MFYWVSSKITSSCIYQVLVSQLCPATITTPSITILVTFCFLLYHIVDSKLLGSNQSTAPSQTTLSSCRGKCKSNKTSHRGGSHWMELGDDHFRLYKDDFFKILRKCTSSLFPCTFLQCPKLSKMASIIVRKQHCILYRVDMGWHHYGARLMCSSM